MKFTEYSPDTVAELLIYLADQEGFASLKNIKNWDKGQVKSVFYEMAQQLKSTATREPIVRKSQLNEQDFGDRTRRVMNKLTPQEEEILLKSFKISS